MRNSVCRKCRSVYVASGMFFALLMPVSVSQAQEMISEEDAYVPGALYVKFADNVVNYAKSARRECSTSVLFPVKADVAQYGLKPMAYSMHMFDNEFLDNVFRLEFDSVSRTEALIQALKADPRVVFVERVPMQQLRWTAPAVKSGDGPDDYFFGNIDNIPTSWHWDMIGFDEIYGYYQGDESVKVAVVDNAVWGDHEDLQLESSNLYDAVMGIPGDANPPSYVSQDQQGSAMATSAAYGWSHGTHCAGVVGALTDNGIGVASLASGVTVMGVKTADDNAQDMVRAVQGVIWAVENGADIVSMSYGSSNYSSVEEAVYAACSEKGVVMIAAAGNDGKEQSNYPASYPGVISVGALNSDGSRASFSNYGPDVDVWAPGGYFVQGDSLFADVMIFSTTYCISQYYGDKEAFSGKYYDMMAGTSMATPVVSSIAALVLSVHPGLNGYQMVELLRPASGQSCVYVPDVLRKLETGAALRVRNLQARWKEEDSILEMRWDEPEQAGVVRYSVYRNGEWIGTAGSATRFKAVLADTAGFVGIRAVYEEDSSFTVYAKFSTWGDGEDETQVEFREVGREIRVDGSVGVLYVPDGLPFDRMELFSVDGRCCLADKGRTQYDVSSLPHGMYIGRLWQGNVLCGVFKVVL